jgi:hypothetical protein
MRVVSCARFIGAAYPARCRLTRRGTGSDAPEWHELSEAQFFGLNPVWGTPEWGIACPTGEYREVR